MNKSANKIPSVFILDDDAFYLEYISDLLSKQFPAVKTRTFNNKEGLLRNLSFHPDIIVLDFNLGVQGSSRITAHPLIDEIEKAHPEQKIVLLSGENSLPLLEEYQRYRHLDYLVKNDRTGADLAALLSACIVANA